MKNNRYLLDTTLRDGGLGFEDAAKNKIAELHYAPKTIAQIAEKLSQANVDIIELGAIEITPHDMRHFAIYQNIEEISKSMPPKRHAGQMCAALYRGPDTPAEDIPRWKPSLCEAVRVIIRYSELQKSLDFCKALSEKGYKVCVQPMLTMRYTDEEIQHMIREANEMHAYALYFVDSYGYMQEKDIDRLFRIYDAGLQPEIKIGFHAHNNMGLAYSNAKYFLNRDTQRDLIADACALGLGQGAGNLQTELISDYLNDTFDKNYDFQKVLEVCEIIEQYWTENTWGYSVLNYLPARHHAAYKYAVAMRHHYGLSLSQIDQVYSVMSSDLKHRYTSDNLKLVLKQAGFWENAQ